MYCDSNCIDLKCIHRFIWSKCTCIGIENIPQPQKSQMEMTCTVCITCMLCIPFTVALPCSKNSSYSTIPTKTRTKWANKAPMLTLTPVKRLTITAVHTDLSELCPLCTSYSTTTWEHDNISLLTNWSTGNLLAVNQSLLGATN